MTGLTLSHEQLASVLVKTCCRSGHVLMLSHEQLANVLVKTLLPLRTEGSIKLPLCRAASLNYVGVSITSRKVGTACTKLSALAPRPLEARHGWSKAE